MSRAGMTRLLRGSVTALSSAGGARGARSFLGEQYWAAWVISGVGLALAGLSLWYLIIVKALYIGTALEFGPTALVLTAIEVALLAGFSLVLVYGGYWLASSPFETERLWWAGLWTMIGLAGIVALVALVVAFQVANGRTVSQPTLIQEMLLAAGGGALGGLLIGVSTVRETAEAEQVKQQRDTLLFVNELLRHNVLNGMQILLGNTDLLREHTTESAQPLLDTNERRAETVVELVQNVRTLVRSVSGEVPCKPVSLSSVLRMEVASLRTTRPCATIETDVPPDVEVYADELLGSVFTNLLTNAVNHQTDDDPHTDDDLHIDVILEAGAERAVVRIADDGPGIPDERKETVFEPGEQGEGSVGQGIGLYLVDTLVDRYGGDVRLEDNDPTGTTAVVELPYPS